jgi:transcriptional regulator with XRE-family HTH domain
MSQVELAISAGVTQSVISAYETGRRQPALTTLLDLVRATGHELAVEIRPSPGHLAGLNGPVGRRWNATGAS